MRLVLITATVIAATACVARAEQPVTQQAAPASSYSLPTSKRGTAFPEPSLQRQPLPTFPAQTPKEQLSSAPISVPSHGQSPDDDLRIYAVGVMNVAPFAPFIMYGVYLGQGAVLTAAHVLGHWPNLVDPTIIIAGQALSAKVIKKGSFEQTDLALLSVDEASLPVSLRLRRNPLCKASPSVGTNVVVVYPDRTARSSVISPRFMPRAYQSRFNTLIRDVQVSGSGAFDADKKCLLGIMSGSVTTPGSDKGQKRHAGFFVPASKIGDFIPAELRF
jgi:hypothetical protein